MKKLIILNLILILIYTILPQEIKQEANQAVENTIEEVQQVETVEEKEISKSNLQIDFEMNLLEVSNITVEELAKAFEGTAMKGLEEYFIQAEKDTGINAIYIAGLACHESDWNTSAFAKERNNLFGWQAYDSNLQATKKFESKQQCISFVAKQIKKTYLTENGMYFNGYTISSVSKRYASDTKHNEKVYKNMQKIVDKIK